MDLHEATAILNAVKTFENIDGRSAPYAKADAGEALAEGIRMFVEDAAAMGGFYAELMEAIGEADEVGIEPDVYADFQVGRFRVHLVHEGERYGRNKTLVYGDSISHGYPNYGEHENDCQKYGHGLPMVEFYDMNNPAFLPEGQMVSSYYLSTLLGMDKFSKDIADMSALSLQGDVPAWTISGDELKEVSRRLHAVRDAYEIAPPVSSLSDVENGARAASESAIETGSGVDDGRDAL